MNLKFGISYNVFDGVELLEDSINHIKKFVDYISVVYQEISYWGEKLTEDEKNILIELHENGLIDELILYEMNNSITIHQNQINKRNLGKQKSESNGCTHHMTLDCDEFYTEEDFNRLIEFHKKNPDKVSYCTLVAYYKDTKYRIGEVGYMDNDLHVSCFFPVKYNLIMHHPTRVKVDPTRKVGCDKNIVHIHKEEVIMHHLSYVRKDIYKKINNAAAKLRYRKNQNKFEYFTECYDNFEENGVALCADGGEYKITEIEPVIKLDRYYSYL